jgi:hypothetical protein
MALAEEIPDAQSAIPAYLEAGWVSLVIDESERAQECVRRALGFESTIGHRTPGVDAKVTVAVIRTGYGEEWIARRKLDANTRRVRAALLLLEGCVVEGADAWALVSPHDEAVARLEAARQLAAEGRAREADVQLERGLAFFRAVGATKIVRDAEGLRAAASSS